MRKVTATEKYRAVTEGQMAKKEFVRQMRLSHPDMIASNNTYNDTVKILSNRGLINEASLDRESIVVSDDSIRRALDIELTVLGCDPVTCTDSEMIEKARQKAIKTLAKDPLHYYNLIAGESSKVDKHDKEVEVKRGEAKQDTFNDMKKAELKEDKAKVAESCNGCKEDPCICEEEIIEADAIPTSPGKIEIGTDGEPHVTIASNAKRKMALRKVIDILTIDGHPEKGYKVSTDEALSFIRTYKDEIFDGTIDFNDAEVIWDEYEESESIDRDSVDEKMSDEFMDQVKNYGKTDKPTKTFEPGDAWSDDFDYSGMLKAALKIRINTPVTMMQKIYNSFEDVNYHRENQHLGAAIDALKNGDREEARGHLKAHKAEIATTIRQISESEDRNFVREGYFGQSNFEQIAGALGYDSLDEFLNDNPGATEGMIEWIGSIPEFRKKLSSEYSTSELEELGFYDFQGYDSEEDEEELDEKKGIDHDKDGDVDGDDYKASKDKAIKKAMGKDEQLVKENLKSIITKLFEEKTLNEAATAKLADWGAGYESFPGVKPVVIELENIVTEVEQFYDKIQDKIANTFSKTAEFKNEEGLKIGAFIAPSLEAAFKQDLRPVIKSGFTSKVDLPKVKRITQSDVQRGYVAETDVEEEKENVFAPTVNGTLRENKKK